jgi:phosphatidylethanolamine/phosphatidyl-N-methylethanolamine N-methyltransferase
MKVVELREEYVRRAYARWASSYDMTFGRFAESSRMAAVAQLNLLPPGRVLEVGVGTGMSLPFYKRHLKVTGIDLSPEMLVKARARVAREKLSQVEAILEMDAAHLDFPDASFDAVAAMYVMTVVPDPTQVMAELARVCKPGGEVMVVNHFSQDHGLRGAVEKSMSRFSERLGWRPVFPLATVMGQTGLVLEEVVSLKPFGLFTLLRFRRGEPVERGQGLLDS